jgi:hypothetical protein
LGKKEQTGRLVTQTINFPVGEQQIPPLKDLLIIVQDVISNPVSMKIVKSNQQSTIPDAATGIDIIHLR